jgi:hypothetical protein
LTDSTKYKLCKKDKPSGARRKQSPRTADECHALKNNSQGGTPANKKMLSFVHGFNYLGRSSTAIELEIDFIFSLNRLF